MALLKMPGSRLQGIEQRTLVYLVPASGFENWQLRTARCAKLELIRQTECMLAKRGPLG